MVGAGPAIRVLGPLEADVQRSPADLGGPRQRAVLALLIAARGQVVSVDRIIDELWRREPPRRAIGGLQAYVSNLRRALEPGRTPRAPSSVLVSAAPGYAIRLPVTAVDAWSFEAALRNAADLAVDRRRTSLRDALALWHGPAFAEFAQESWAAAEAARFDELRAIAREQLIEATIRDGAAAEAAVDAEALVRDAPLREEGWRLLALSQYAASRQAEALATLRRARTMLLEELGVDPGPRLAQLEQAILEHAVELPRPAAVSMPVASPPGPAPQERTAFIGRARELEALREAAVRAAPKRPGIVVISGEAGAGKSALIARFVSDLRDEGWRVAIGRCPELAGGPPAWGFSEALRTLAAESEPGPFREALAPLLLDEIPAAPEDALFARFQLHRAVASWLSSLSDRPLILGLDDVHRADDETRLILTNLLATPVQSRVLVVLAHRSESAPVLDELLADLARYVPTRVRLEGLDEVDSSALIETITGSAVDPDVLDVLVERTEGNPFFLEESARLLASEGAAAAVSQVPAGVGEVLRRRIARLPDETASVLRLASVIGRTVDVALLIRAAAADEDRVLDAVEAGAISGLLIDDGPGTVRFAHVLGREALYTEIPGVRRRAWHGAVAEALEQTRPDDIAALAHHSAQAAVTATAGTAAAYSIAAARQAENRYSYDSAAALYRAALRCLDLAVAPSRRRAEVLMLLIPALIRAGDTSGALALRNDVVTLAADSDDAHLMAAAIVCGNVPSSWANRPFGFVDADFVALIESTLQNGSLTANERCLVLNTLVRETSYSDDPRTAAASDDALRIARGLEDPELIALSLLGASEVYLADLHPAERDAIRHELRAVSEQHGLVAYELLAHLMDMESAMAYVDLDAVRRELDVAAAMAHKFQLEQPLMIVGVMEAMLAHVGGDLDESERRYGEVYRMHSKAGGVTAEGQYQLALLTLRTSQGRTAELAEPWRYIYGTGVPGGGEGFVTTLLAQGETEQARQILRGLAPRAHDILWLVSMTYRGMAYASLGERDLAAAMYEELTPFAAQIAGAPWGYAVTPVARVLGQLACVLGRPEDARGHFEQARHIAARCGNDLWLAQIQADLAAL